MCSKTYRTAKKNRQIEYSVGNFNTSFSIVGRSGSQKISTDIVDLRSSTQTR